MKYNDIQYEIEHVCFNVVAVSVVFIFVVLMFIENDYLFTMFVLLFLCRIVVNNNQQFQIKKYLPDFDLYVHIKYTTIWV